MILISGLLKYLLRSKGCVTEGFFVTQKSALGFCLKNISYHLLSNRGVNRGLCHFIH